jgi:hypothetical protein
MNERKMRMLEIMETCVLRAEFCDQCPNVNGTYEDCRALHEEFFREVRSDWEAEEEDGKCETTGIADPDHKCTGAAHH